MIIDISVTVQMCSFSQNLYIWIKIESRPKVMWNLCENYLNHVVIFSAPGVPANVKAAVLSATSVLITWLPPISPNGEITKYTLYIKDAESRHSNTDLKIISSHLNKYAVKDLLQSREYIFWISASTRIGEGPVSKIIKIKTSRSSM